MVKKVIFNVLLNVLLIACVVLGSMGYKAGNYFVPILCAAAFGLTLFYKIKLSKQVREEMKAKAQQNVSRKAEKSKKPVK
mgnify:CR=1 FL=1